MIDIAFESFVLMIITMMLIMVFGAVVGYVITNKNIGGIFGGFFLSGLLAIAILPGMWGII